VSHSRLTTTVGRLAKAGLQSTLRSLGFELRRYDSNVSSIQFRRRDWIDDIDAATRELFKYVESFTMTGIEDIAVLRQAVEYIVRHDIPGDIVECGVWKGGSMMAIARTLIEHGDATRALYLCDTFSGMTTPTSVDKDFLGIDAQEQMDDAIPLKSTAHIWAVAPLDAVKRAMSATGYDQARIQYVRGRVEDTLPCSAPEAIALLRLDTDWFESTYHEMLHLFPRLVRGGVLIVDDYGHWKGSRLAVDKYLQETKTQLLLNRINYSARIAVKC
jgi:hypothetical protein